MSDFITGVVEIVVVLLTAGYITYLEISNKKLRIENREIRFQNDLLCDGTKEVYENMNRINSKLEENGYNPIPVSNKKSGVGNK